MLRDKLLLATITLWTLLASQGCQKTIPLEAPTKSHINPEDINLTLEDAIAKNKLEVADNLYLDFREDHYRSQKISALMLQLSKAHMQQQEYLLANYYAQSYASDYPDGSHVDEAWYLQLRSYFLRFKSSKESSMDIYEQFDEASKVYIENIRKKEFRTKVKEMQEEAKEIQKNRNEALALYYEKLNKPKAAEFYRELLNSKK